MRNLALYAIGGLVIALGILARDVPLIVGGCAYWTGLCAHRLRDAWMEDHR